MKINIQLLQWGLFSFMLGLVLSLPLAAVIYQNNSPITKFFTNSRKLKSAHLDFFMQAFALVFVYILEFSVKIRFPMYVVIPLVFGTIMNPSILLLEATPIHRSGLTANIYRLLKVTSPLSLFFAWCAISFQFLPGSLKFLLLAVVIIGLVVYLTYQSKLKKQSEQNQSIAK